MSEKKLLFIGFICFIIILTEPAYSMVNNSTNSTIKIQNCGIIPSGDFKFEIGQLIELEESKGLFRITEIRTRETYHGIVESYCAEEAE